MTTSEAETGRLGEESNAEWRPRTPVPFGLLPVPAGATVGKAIDVNASGEVIVSYGTPSTLPTGLTVMSYKPYLYSRGQGLIDLSAIYTSLTTFPEPVDLTDGGRILLTSGQILEPDGGVTPTPPFPEPPRAAITGLPSGQRA